MLLLLLAQEARSFHRPLLPASTSKKLLAQDEQDTNDFLVYDSLSLPSSARPSLVSSVSNPRDSLALALLTTGFGISIANIFGRYGPGYVALEVISVALGAASLAAACFQIIDGSTIRQRLPRRRGIADDATVTLFGGCYSGAVSWLALRASEASPS